MGSMANAVLLTAYEGMCNTSFLEAGEGGLVIAET